MSHFFAYLARMKFIERWGLMNSLNPENIQEHSLQVSMIAHALALIKNRFFGGKVDAGRLVVLALYHDASEVITGDLPTPIKYFNPKIKQAYKEIEAVANARLLELLPDELKPDYESILMEQDQDRSLWKLVKAADKIAAYLKCIGELNLGNQEFSQAKKVIKRSILELDLPEVDYFMEHFVPSFNLTLDELG